MSSLFGVAGVAQPTRTLKRMAAAYTYGKTLFEQPAGIGLVYLPGFKNAPAWNKGRTVCVLVSGDIYTDRRVANPSKHVLEAYLKLGVDCARNLNGVFSIVIVDSRSREVHCIQDRIGASSLYYSVVDKQLIFGSEIKAVLASGLVPLEVDWLACRDIFTYGFPVIDNTIAKGVRMLSGATILTFRNGSASLHKYWSANEVAVNFHSSREELVETGAHIMREVMARQTADLDEAVIFLSGGYDSRCIAAATKGLPVRISTYTTDYPGSMVDSIYAAKVAKHLGLPNTHVRVPAQSYKAFQDYARIVDWEYAEHSWALPLAKRFRQPLVNFDGFCGDWLLHGTREELLFTGKRKNDLAMGKYLHDLMMSFKGGPHSEWRVAAPLVSEEVRALWSSHPNSLTILLKDSPRTYYNVTVAGMAGRAHRVVSSLSTKVIGRHLHCRFPFLDNALIDFGLAVPLRRGDSKMKLYRDIIERLSPGIMAVPSTNDDPLLLRIKIIIWKASIEFFPWLAEWWQKRVYRREERKPLPPSLRQQVEYFAELSRTLTYPPGFDKVALQAELKRYAQQGLDPRAILVPSLMLGLWWRDACQYAR